MKLIAITNVKHGPHGETAAPGEAFEVSADIAEVLIASGSAATSADYELDRRANQAAEARIAELERDVAAARDETARLNGESERLQADTERLRAATGGRSEVIQ